MFVNSLITLIYKKQKYLRLIFPVGLCGVTVLCGIQRVLLNNNDNRVRFRSHEYRNVKRVV